MFQDIDFFKAKLGKIDGFEDAGEHLEKIIRAKEIKSSPAPTPAPPAPSTASPAPAPAPVSETPTPAATEPTEDKEKSSTTEDLESAQTGNKK